MVAARPAVRGCARLSPDMGFSRCGGGAAAPADVLLMCCAVAEPEPPGTELSSRAVCRGARSVRAAAVRFVAEAASRLGAAEVYALLLPLVQPALERPVSDLSSERVSLLGAGLAATADSPRSATGLRQTAANSFRGTKTSSHQVASC